MRLLFCAATACAAVTVAWSQTPTVTEVSSRQPPATSRPRTPRPKPQSPATIDTPPPLLWKTFLKRLDNAPAVDADKSGTASDKTTLYLGANNALTCLDGGGRTQWATTIGATQVQPAFDTIRVYTGTDRGAFYALNRENGRVVWKYSAPSTILSTPVVLPQNRVLFECSDGDLYALQATTGTLAWSFKRSDGSLGYSSPVLDNGAVFVCGENTLYKLGAGDGKEVWRTPIGGKSLGTPSIEANRVFVGGDGVGITALNAQTGKALWTFGGLPNSTGNEWFGSPLVSSGTAYVSTYNRVVYALDAQTGRVKWSAHVLGAALARPTLDTKRNVLYVTSITFRDNPTITAFDARTGAKLWDYKGGYVASPPVLAGDRLYVASTNGYLYAFGLK